MNALSKLVVIVIDVSLLSSLYVNLMRVFDANVV